MVNRLLSGLCLSLCTFYASAAEPAVVNPTAKSATVLSETRPPQPAPDKKKQTNAFPVIFSEVEIFNVQSSPLGSLSPAERSQLIHKNIQALAASKADLSELKIIELAEGYGIGTSNLILLIVTRQDADLAGKDQKKLALEILLNIHDAIKSYRTVHSWQVYGLGATFTLLSIIALWQVLFWNNRAFKWLHNYIFTGKRFWKKGIRFKQVELLSGRRLDDLFVAMLNILRLLVVLLSLYFFLPIILSFFPETREYFCASPSR